MSLYTVKVFKGGQEVRQFEVCCSAGRDPDPEQAYEDDGSPVTWTEAEQDRSFEEELEAVLQSWSAGFPAGYG